MNTPEAYAVGGFVGFLLGVVVGLMLAEAFTVVRTGHTRLMSIIARRVSADFQRRAAVGLIVVSLLVNASVGFLLIQNGRQDRDRVQCSIEFNRDQQAALDERGARAGASTDAEIALWEGILQEVDDVAAARAKIEEYVAQLRSAQASRAENPYPPADLCRISP